MEPDFELYPKWMNHKLEKKKNLLKRQADSLMM